MELKIGDRVLLKENLHGCNQYVSELDEYAGKIVTVAGVWPDGDFNIKEDNGAWFYSPDMIERVGEEVKVVKFKVGERVKVAIDGEMKVGEILFNDGSNNQPWLVGIKGLDGHNGEPYTGDDGQHKKTVMKIVKQKGYEGQCWWVSENCLTSVEKTENIEADKEEPFVLVTKESLVENISKVVMKLVKETDSPMLSMALAAAGARFTSDLIELLFEEKEGKE